VSLLRDYRVINHWGGGSAFDLGGQTRPQCELTVGDERLLAVADSGVCVCVCVCVRGLCGGGDGG